MTKPTAQSVAAELISHEKVCTERYGNLWDAVKELKATIQDSRGDREREAKEMRDRFDAISNRMWVMLCSVCGAAIIGVAALAFHMLTK